MISEKAQKAIFFTLLVVALSIATVLFPWWRIYSSRESQIEQGFSIKTEYKLTGIIDARRTTAANDPTSLTISISELDGQKKDKDALKSFLQNTLYLAITGSTFNVLAFALILTSIFIPRAEPFSLPKYSRYLTVLAAIIFLIASFYFASQIQSFLFELETVIPSQVYELSGSQITGVFGSADSLIYGPSFGWYLAFVTFLLSISLYKILKTLEKTP